MSVQLGALVFVFQIGLDLLSGVDKVVKFWIIGVGMFLDSVRATSITAASAARGTARLQQVSNMRSTNKKSEGQASGGSGVEVPLSVELVVRSTKDSSLETVLLLNLSFVSSAVDVEVSQNNNTGGIDKHHDQNIFELGECLINDGMTTNQE